MNFLLRNIKYKKQNTFINNNISEIKAPNVHLYDFRLYFPTEKIIKQENNVLKYYFIFKIKITLLHIVDFLLYYLLIIEIVLKSRII